MKLEYHSRVSKKEQVRAKLRLQRNKTSGYDMAISRDHDFICLYCKQIVSGAAFLSGVRNRNHCPYCLHSRHMDLHQPGDRLSACKAAMRPIGLTLKWTPNKYRESSEVMLVHRCLQCGKLSINRIAADDFQERILEVFSQVKWMDSGTRQELDRAEIRLLEPKDLSVLETRLLGKLAEASELC